jgi:hypothetical protein
MEQSGYVLCEIAETPDVLRAKVFQLLRAMHCGPFRGEKTPVLTVACINGEEGKARVAVESLFAGLRRYNSDESVTLNGVPFVVVYTRYRNTYAEVNAIKKEMGVMQRDIRSMEHSISGMEHKISGMQHDIRGMQQDMRDVKSDISSLSGKMDTKFDAMLSLLQRRN